MKKNTSETKRIDWMITLVPLLLIVGLCVIFLILRNRRALCSVRCGFSLAIPLACTI